MKNLLSEIRNILKSKAKLENKISTQKFVSTKENIYGVKVRALNNLADRFKKGGFGLVEALWKSGAFEEKLLAAKILGKICKENPTRSLSFIKKASRAISDWAICDTLATQAIRKIATIKRREILELSKKLISSKNFWQRRFALVLLINYKKEKKLRKQIKQIIKKVKYDKECYVKKAIVWLEKEIRL